LVILMARRLIEIQDSDSDCEFVSQTLASNREPSRCVKLEPITGVKREPITGVKRKHDAVDDDATATDDPYLHGFAERMQEWLETAGAAIVAGGAGDAGAAGAAEVAGGSAAAGAAGVAPPLVRPVAVADVAPPVPPQPPWPIDYFWVPNQNAGRAEILNYMGATSATAKTELRTFLNLYHTTLMTLLRKRGAVHLHDIGTLTITEARSPLPHGVHIVSEDGVIQQTLRRGRPGWATVKFHPCQRLLSNLSHEVRDEECRFVIASWPFYRGQDAL
jgi:hypothetical protein